MKGKYAARSANAKAATAEATTNAVRARLEAEVSARDAQIAALSAERDEARRNIEALATQRAAEVVSAERETQRLLREENGQLVQRLREAEEERDQIKRKWGKAFLGMGELLIDRHGYKRQDALEALYGMIPPEEGETQKSFAAIAHPQTYTKKGLTTEQVIAIERARGLRR